jgi:integrase
MASIRKRSWKTGKGEPRSAWILDYIDRDGDRQQLQFPTKAEAITKRQDVETELRAGTHTPSKKSPTVPEATDRWLSAAAARLERSTSENYRQHASIISAAFRTVKLADLTTPDITEFRDDLLTGAIWFRPEMEAVECHIKTNRSPSTVRKTLFCLKAIINKAREDGFIGQNVAESVKVKADKRGKKQAKEGRDFPTMAEMQRLINACHGVRARAFLMVAAFTGLRNGEMRGLHWRNVDLRGHKIHVCERADWWGTMGDPKSEESHRDVPIDAEVAHALRYLKAASRFSKDDDLVWPDGDGNVAKRSALITEVFLQAHRTAGLPTPDYQPKYGPHSFRHFYASQCLCPLDQGGRGLTLKETQERLGHATLAMTADTYGHLFARDAESTRRVEANAVAGVMQHKSNMSPIS